MDKIELERRMRNYHFHQLVIAVFIISAAFILTPASPGEKCVALFGFKLPQTCPHIVFFNQPCPGCGLTRSFVAFAHGKFVDSFTFHRVGPFLFLLVVLQIPLRLILIFKESLLSHDTVNFLLSLPPRIIVGALLINWILVLKGV